MLCCVWCVLLMCSFIFYQRKLRNLTSDSTESCRQVLQHRCLTAEMFWVLWLCRLAKSAPKNGSWGGAAAEDVAKICTTLWRDSDLEAKITKTPWARSTFGSWTLQYTLLYYIILYSTLLYLTLPFYTILCFTMLYYTILYFTILYFTIRYYTWLYFTILYFTLLYFTLLYDTILYSTLLYFTLLYFTLLYYTILYFTILYYSLPYYILFFCTIRYHTKPYCTILYHTILYSTILYYICFLWSDGGSFGAATLGLPGIDHGHWMPHRCGW